MAFLIEDGSKEAMKAFSLKILPLALVIVGCWF